MTNGFHFVTYSSLSVLFVFTCGRMVACEHSAVLVVVCGFLIVDVHLTLNFLCQLTFVV